MSRTIRTALGTYLIRGSYTVRDLRRLYESYCHKYGAHLSFDRWLVERGKVYLRVK